MVVRKSLAKRQKGLCDVSFRGKGVPQCNIQQVSPLFIPTQKIDKTGFLHLLIQLFAKFVRSENCGMWGHEKQPIGYFSEFKKPPAPLCF